MAYDEEFRELVSDAIDAIDKLLDESRADAFMLLRSGYGQLRDALDRDDRKRAGAAPQVDTRAQSLETQRLRKAARESWITLPSERRESLVLEVIGDARRTTREITTQINDRLVGPDAEQHSAVWTSDITGLVKSMFDAGQLERATDPGSRRRRFVYSRKRDLCGPIADLEKAFHDRR